MLIVAHIDEHNNVLKVLIHAIGVVLGLKVRAEDSGNALPPEGFEISLEHRDDFVTRMTRLAVHKFDEDATLADG